MNDKVLLCIVFIAPSLQTLNREYKTTTTEEKQERSVPGANLPFTAYPLLRIHQERQAGLSVLGLDQETREQK